MFQQTTPNACSARGLHTAAQIMTLPTVPQPLSATTSSAGTLKLTEPPWRQYSATSSMLPQANQQLAMMA